MVLITAATAIMIERREIESMGKYHHQRLPERMKNSYSNLVKICK
jgi:hypothetical protein